MYSGLRVLINALPGQVRPGTYMYGLATNRELLITKRSPPMIHWETEPIYVVSDGIEWGV